MWENLKSDWSENKNTFYTESIDEDGNFEMDDKLFKKFQEKNTQIISKVEQIGLPEKKQQLRFVTIKPFNTISIIEYIARKEKIIDSIFVIFAINKSAAKILIQLKNEGFLSNYVIYVSSIRNAGHRRKSEAVQLLQDAGFNIKFIYSHAKISILKTEKNNYYNIEGSGNFSFNARLEQYIIDNDKKLYQFSQEWISEL